jgi:undecaprenyl-diphosphatase
MFLTGVAIGIVLLIGSTRLYLGLHYPTDVVAGWCVGGLWFVLCRLLIRHVLRT